MNSLLDSARLGRRTLLGATSALIALGGRGRTSATSSRRVRFAYFGTDIEQRAFRRLIEVFHEHHADITVEPVGMGSGDPSLAMGRASGSPYQLWIETAFTSQTPPDVFMLSYQRFRSFAMRGLVEPLGGYLSGSALLKEDDFYSNALEAFRFEEFPDRDFGGLPLNASSLGVYYNLDLFDEFNVPYPSAGWDWATFASTAARLTVDRDGDGRIGTYGLVLDPTISRYAAFIWGAGGDFVDDPTYPTKLVLDTPEAHRGLKMLASLGPSDMKVTPSEAELRGVSDLVRFSTGKAAMMIHSRRVVPALREMQSLRWDVAPLPIDTVAANVLHSDALCLATGARDKEAAWTFLEFAIGPIGQAILAETGRTVPSLKSVAESDAFLKGSGMASTLGLQSAALPPHNNRAFIDNIAISRKLPSITTLPALEASFNQSFKRAFFVDADIPTATTSFFAASRGVLGDRLSVPRYALLDPEILTAEE